MRVTGPPTCAGTLLPVQSCGTKFRYTKVLSPNAASRGIILMKVLALIVLLLSFAAPSHAVESAFITMDLGGIARLALPRSWTLTDAKISEQINTSSEAAARLGGLEINRGDNRVLVSANAFDSMGNVQATIRLSVSPAPGLSQADMRELSALTNEEVQPILKSQFMQASEALLNVPGVKSLNVKLTSINQNNSLVCMRVTSEFERDLLYGIFVSDYWICPLGDRAIKLSTSYKKDLESIYRPTIEYVWSTLEARNENVKRGSMSDLSIIDLALFFFATWTIGLSLPLLFRFVILRKPINKWVAFATAVIWWFANITFWVWMGSQSKSHTVLFVIALVTFYILTYRPKNQSEIEAQMQKKAQLREQRQEEIQRQEENKSKWS